MTALAAALIWLAGFVIVVVTVLVLIRDEPTAHGQIVGRQVGCVIGVFWPLALVYALFLGIVLGARWIWRTVR